MKNTAKVLTFATVEIRTNGFDIVARTRNSHPLRSLMDLRSAEFDKQRETYLKQVLFDKYLQS